ncbi:hypothetical protein NQ314_020928 [Rhamnusium bicolor]|uniref:ER lumen protein-retaining receptor n=1 Tax=Rhamnusium bicolor TaxID=1586634 RepID=A0AAV8WIW3_9CUCU|nr:hypothetical protein NQ314_020928 [Rhamnusium bicolor]
MSMNAFRLIGDTLHVFAITILLLKILRSKSCAGISGRSQILFALVYTTRYLDLNVYYSLYNTLMKILFITASYTALILIFWVYRTTYQHKKDVFLTEILIIPSFIMAIWFNHEFTPLEVSEDIFAD